MKTERLTGRLNRHRENKKTASACTLRGQNTENGGFLHIILDKSVCDVNSNTGGVQAADLPEK